MTQYVCNEYVERVNIHGGQTCVNWQELVIPSEGSATTLDAFAISVEDAGALTLAICGLMVIAFVGGLIGRSMMQL